MNIPAPTQNFISYQALSVFKFGSGQKFPDRQPPPAFTLEFHKSAGVLPQR